MNAMSILDFLTLGNRVEKPSRKRGRRRGLSCGIRRSEVVLDPPRYLNFGSIVVAPIDGESWLF